MCPGTGGGGPGQLLRLCCLAACGQELVLLWDEGTVFLLVSSLILCSS